MVKFSHFYDLCECKAKVNGSMGANCLGGEEKNGYSPFLGG